MADDTIVRTLSNQKLKGLMKGKEDDLENDNPKFEISADFQRLILDMKGMLDPDLAQTA